MKYLKHRGNPKYSTLNLATLLRLFSQWNTDPAVIAEVKEQMELISPQLADFHDDNQSLFRAEMLDSSLFEYIDHKLSGKPAAVEAAAPANAAQGAPDVAGAIKAIKAQHRGQWNNARAQALLRYAQLHVLTLSLDDVLMISRAMVKTQLTIPRILFLAWQHDSVELDALARLYYQAHKNNLKSADDIIRLADSTGTTQAEDEILLEFAQLHSAYLNTDEILRLADATNTTHAQDEIISNYFKARISELDQGDRLRLIAGTASRSTEAELTKLVTGTQLHSLSAEEAITMAGAVSSSSETDEILRSFMMKHFASTNVTDAIRLAEATASGSAQDEILLKYSSENLKNLSVNDAIALAEATSSSGAQDEIITDYAEANAETLSVSEILELGEAMASCQDDLLIDFAKSQDARLRVGQLRELMEACIDESEIETIIDNR